MPGLRRRHGHHEQPQEGDRRAHGPRHPLRTPPRPKKRDQRIRTRADRILRPRSRLDAYPDKNTFGATITFATSHALKLSARGRPASTYRNERTMNTVPTREIPAARIHA